MFASRKAFRFATRRYEGRKEATHLFAHSLRDAIMAEGTLEGRCDQRFSGVTPEGAPSEAESHWARESWRT